MGIIARSAALTCLWLAGLIFCACDERTQPLKPPGGYRQPVDATGVAAIRAVLLMPSHGHYHTVREALLSYLGMAGKEVRPLGWSVAPAITGPVPFYRVSFAWFDGVRDRSAEWELDHFGIWPINDEARLLAIFPPEDGR